ncbi:MAG: response regulator transcription factor [Alphaproteobacteria bacterium]|nr:response regulator transcription factor [Alphaproteobacteria bacterium]MBU0876523.1 response regulator transcription factor [Alphaproteobacteria bacterium]MBU1770994.1 response regulator transcription factor [Alphaproteobacteria bacterium]
MKIAVVDDDPQIAEHIFSIVVKAGFQCDAFPNGKSFVAAQRRNTFDLVFLDWNLPDTTGLELVRDLRAATSGYTRVIMLTSRSDKDDVAEALNLGADDYIVKPESPQVIKARMDAVLRRGAPATVSRIIEIDGYRFDRLTDSVFFDEESVDLSGKEFALAQILLENPHKPLSRAYLLQKIWNNAADLSTRTLDVHVSKLRLKLQLRPERGYRIVPIAGYGYRLERFLENNQ